ncbi:MAG: hypothetical protein Q4B13_06690 [Lautropia sp.]|nr:hypothetical protein [Lautropia sp.]
MSVLSNIPRHAVLPLGAYDKNGLLNVFRDAADFFYDHETAFRVFYSVRK